MPFKLLLVVILVSVACGSAPTVLTPAVTVAYVTTTPEVVTPAPEASPTTASVLPGMFPPEAVVWLKANAVPFKTSQPGSGFDDLAAVRSMVGDARLVSLGEATHGTHEFFEMKARLFESLVTEMGFNSFAMEVGWPEANLLNDYIQTGQGNPRQLLAGMGYWMWNTQEVLDLVLWMRAYNEQAGNRPHLNFYGFDMQSPWLAMDSVVEYLREVNPHASAWADRQYDCLRHYRNAGSKYAAAYVTVRLQCRQALQSVYDLLVRRRVIFENLTSVSDYNFTLQSAHIPQQTEQFFAGPYDTAARDQAMADNVTSLLQQAGPGAKMVLWAHNLHVGVIRNDPPGNNSMGWHLRQTYGANMVVVGFSFYQGSFNAVSTIDNAVKSHPLPAPLRDSYESFFHSANLPRLLVDLRSVLRDMPATAWLSGPHPFYAIGGAYGEEFPAMYQLSVSLPQVYDIMIYFQDTTPSILLPFPSI